MAGPVGSVYLQGSGQPSQRLLEPLWSGLVPSGRRARVAIVTAALASMPSLVSRVAGWFGGRGFRVGGLEAEVSRVVLPGERGGDAATARAAIAAADFIWLTGGDPVAGAKLLAASGADVWLREARAAGVSLGGGSAGAIVLGAWWAEWPDKAPATAPFDGGSLVACSGVVGDLVVDTHAEADGWSELRLVDGLLRAAGRRDGLRLYGVPTDGAVLVGGDGQLTAFGDVYGV